MDQIFAPSISIFAPALTILLYGVLKCRGEASSFPVLGGLAAGMGCAVCALGIEMAEGHIVAFFSPRPELRAAVVAFGVAAPVEEGLKLFALISLLEFGGPRPMQRILLGALAISVGFAIFETYLYVNYAPASAKVGLAVLRGSTAVPAHGLFSLVMGSLAVSAAIYPDSRRALLVLAFLVPWGLHGLYDFFAMSPASTGLPQKMRWVLAFGAFIAIRHFNRILPRARTEDGNRGETWQPPQRVWLFATGSLGLVWPAILVSATIRAPSLAHSLPMLGVLPGTMASDLVASAFKRDRTRLLR